MLRDCNNSPMTNALDQHRQKASLSYAALGRAVGKDRATIMRHCKAANVPKGARLDYHMKLGIPLEAFEPSITTIADQG